MSGFTATATAIDGLWQVRPKAVTDERGTVRELFRASAFAGLADVPDRWEQVNLTWSRHGAVRGLHGEAMTKLVGVADGEAFGVYLDARADSPTRGVVVTVPLVLGVQVLIPPGVCNGFQVVSPQGCTYLYLLGTEWAPGMAGTAVNPLDPALAIAWPLPIDATDRSIISAKDADAPSWTAG